MSRKTVIRARSFGAAHRPLAIALALGIGGMATPALADCVADASGLVVTCSGTSAAYSNAASGVTLTAQSGGTITGPVVLGASSNTSNAGTLNGAAGSAALTVGANSTVTNAATGKIAQANTTAGSEGVVLGDNSTLTNNGTLTAATGFNVARFGTNGSFINTANAPAAVVGNIVYAASLGSNVSRFTNQNTAFGFVGSLSATGNLAFDNSGIFSGSVQQAAGGGAVSVSNQAAGTFTGFLSTIDPTTASNAGTMTLTGASVLGSAGAAGTTFANTGKLSLGNATSVGTLDVKGSFTQSAAGTLGLTIGLPGSTGPVAGTNFSQLHTGGTATLDGTLALTLVGGYYPTGTVYNVVVGDTGVSGAFSSVTGNKLTFVTFVPIGIVTVSGTQQAYQLQVQRTTTYAAGLGASATANQLALATAFQPLVSYADAHKTSDVARLVGTVDVLTAAQAQTFFDRVSPAGYLAYANSLRDHAQNFQRQVSLRMGDFHAESAQRGWWLNFGLSPLNSGTVGTDKTKRTGFNAAGGYDFSGPTYLIGIAGGYSHATLKYAPGSMEGKDSAYQIGTYGSLTMKPLVASLIVDYQFGNLNAIKISTIGSATRAAAARSKSHLLTATGTLGARFDTGSIAFQPFAGVQIHRGAINGFTETDAGAANLVVGRIKADRTDLLAGATLARSNGSWRPYVKGTYRSQIGTGPTNLISASFAEVTGTGFSVTGRGAAKNELDVDAGLNWVSGDEGGLFIAYQGTFRNDLTSHGVVAGIRIQF